MCGKGRQQSTRFQYFLLAYSSTIVHFCDTSPPTSLSPPLKVFTPHDFPKVACVNYTMPTYSTPPTTRAEAMARMEKYFTCRMEGVAKSTGQSMTSAAAVELTCHYYYSGFGAALFPDRVKAVACEVGENGNSINAHYAFNRGASRQFQIPWMVDFSACTYNGRRLFYGTVF